VQALHLHPLDARHGVQAIQHGGDPRVDPEHDLEAHDEQPLVAEALLVPLVALLFSAALFTKPLLLAGLLATGTIGFCAVGTLFAAMLLRARTRDVLLPILLYPITVPVMIAGVRGTVALLASPPDEPTATMWLVLLACFDVVFVTLALWTFEPLMTE